MFEKKLKGSYSNAYIQHLFKGSGSFVESLPNEINCLIVDEAHRLREKSGMFNNKGENQIKEIINASQFSIFFIDESQKVTALDVGSIDMIGKYAKELDSECRTMYLASQFRCNGSDGYLAWLDDVLEIRKTANFDFFDADLNYDFRVFDDPQRMFDAISEKNLINNKSRVVAGYCWEWISSGKNDSNVYDINVDEYDFHKSWNLYNTTTWAIDPESINEIGCIHTCQGLEFDYVGVIIGDDLRYENDEVITDFSKRAGTDQSLKGLKTRAKKGDKEALEECDLIIRNTYRTLMTRGMKGCYVFCTDKNLNDYLLQRLQRNNSDII